MLAAVIVFPGSNCDRDAARALAAACGRPPVMVWHRDAALPRVDAVVVPGGFAHGDYLRGGAMAARSPVMAEVARRAGAGVPVLGICNGFQVLTEAGLLPGALMRNAGVSFICRDVELRVENVATPFTRGYGEQRRIRLPVAHNEGCYFADDDTLRRLEDEGRVVLRYVTAEGEATDAGNPNGSRRNIAGIVSAGGNVVGLMPHPERAADPALGNTDGRAMFRSLAAA